MNRRASALLLLFVPAVVGYAQEDLTPRSLEFTVQGAVSYGAASGFLQTPEGGQPGSSSSRRPTLHELGIDDTPFYEGSLRVQIHHFGLYGGYQHIGLQGDGTLTSDLVSRGVTFPAGSPVETDTRVDWYSVGAGWKIMTLERRLELFPKAEVAFLDYHYELSGAGQSVNRDFVKACVRLGLESSYHFSRVLSLRLNADASPPISNTPQIARVAGILELQLLPRSKTVRPVVFLGTGAQRIDYEDNQDLPNHVRVDLAPYGTAGLGLSF